MAIAYDASSKAATTTTPLTFSHTCGSGSDRLLVVGVSIRGAVTVTGITYAAVALTKIRHDAPGGDVRSELWYLVAPATGANNVVVTMSGDQSFAAIAQTYTGVHQTVPKGTDVGSTGSGTAVTVDVTSATGELVIDVVTRQASGGTFTEGASQTKRQTHTTQPGGSMSEEAGAATVTMSWTISSEDYAQCAVPFKPAGALVSTYMTLTGAGV